MSLLALNHHVDATARLCLRHFASTAIRCVDSSTPSPPKKRGYPPRRVISSLDPRSLTSTDHLILSGVKALSATFPPGGWEQLWYHNEGNRARLPFPQNTSGFLYYHRPPNATPLEGDVRFRCTPTPSPSSFSAGHDLLLPWGGPWQIVIPQLARRKEIAAQLVQQQLVPEAQLSRATELFGTKHIHLPSILFRLNGQFRLNFTKNLYLQAVGEDAVHELAFVLDFCGKYRDTGSAVARFEPSMMDNRPVVHMRIVKLVEPFVRELHDPAHRYAEPREGELLILVNSGGHPKPWTFDLKRSTESALGLRALWNASRKPSSIS
ncbi:hypothetical protein C8R46DRAFT_1004891 [Mycena filopes]|nr:hypothetical protein C8R46DRAFT_1004891 [Mycena filopes]